MGFDVNVCCWFFLAGFQEVRRCIFSYLDDMELIRSGEMISYLVALTFGIGESSLLIYLFALFATKKM